MLTDSHLREMLAFSAPEPVLSVYLNTEPGSGSAESHRLRLRTLLKDVNLPQDTAAVERFMEHEYAWTGKGVAIFSCAPQGYLKVFPLALPVRDLVLVSDRPALKPLAGLFENYSGYGVVLIDKQGARLFSFHLGELSEQEGYLGEEIKHTKLGGASSVPGRRGGVAGHTHYADELVERNMKEAAAFAARFFENHHVRRILIGGSDDNVSQFRGYLPKAWQSLIVATFRMSMTASHAEVLEETLRLGAQAEHEREARLVEEIITAARKQSGAVTGLPESLAAVNDKRVQLLLVNDGYREPGYQCGACQRLTVYAEKTCSGCQGAMHQSEDVVEAAVNAVLRAGGEVEVVRQNEALDEVGRMAARLRY